MLRDQRILVTQADAFMGPVFPLAGGWVAR